MWPAHIIVQQHMKGALILRNIPDKQTCMLQMLQKSEIYITQSLEEKKEYPSAQNNIISYRVMKASLVVYLHIIQQN